MPTVHLICGATGAGKTTYALSLAKAQQAIRFSIDPWMQTLFMADAKDIQYEWMMERIGRCEAQMWDVARQILSNNGDVILDLGFTTRAHREQHRALAIAAGAEVSLHYLDIPTDIRLQRVHARNNERDPAVYAMEVTDDMFHFMESIFEQPNEEELRGGKRICIDT